MLFHAQSNKKLNEDELKQKLEFYFKLNDLVEKVEI